jgi:DNA-binding transcriptional LysR family regulator
MTLRHLNIFLTVCTQGTMTRAAEVLGMAQPPVSQAIAELEAHYGTLLFERRGRSLILTAAGDRLQTYAAHIGALVTEARSSLRDLEEYGHLKVGASKTVGATLLPRVCQRFRGEYPRSELNLVVDNTAVVLEQLRAAELDVAVVEGMVADGQSIAEPLCRDEMVLVCHPGHPWAHGSVEAAALGGQAFFVREPGSGTRETFESTMAARGLVWTKAGDIGGVAAMVALVGAGLGLAYLPERTVRGPLARAEVAPVTVEGLTMARTFHLVTHENKPISPALVSFSRLAREEALKL